ncbi:MAG: DUF3782 domain-containing protein, partial [Verrucomicrobiota bacterium]
MVTDQQLREMVLKLEEANEKARIENEKTQRENKKMLRDLGRQIGGLGEKFGTFAEGLAYNSIRRILSERFGLSDYVSPGVLVKKQDKTQEYDVLAYSNGSTNRAMIVEIKSKLRHEDIAKM